MARQRQMKAFTLIELLVVVAIIVVLVAILLPGLGRAKAQAASMVGLSNLKQIGYGLVMYASESNDYLPPGLQSGVAWYNQVNTYLSPVSTSFSKVFRDPTARMPMGNMHYTSNPLLMPETSRNFGSGYKLTRSYRISQLLPFAADLALVFDGAQMEARNGNCEATAWQVDGGFLFGLPYGGGYLPLNNANRSKVIAPGPNTDAYGGWLYPPGGTIRWRQRDDRSANFLFGDGHAENMNMSRVTRGNLQAYKPD